MSRTTDVILTASAPAIWGSTYIVTTQLLPADYPLTVSVLRALPAGLLLMAITRQLPPRAFLSRLILLGALNFSIFWAALFVAAYRLPGGVAATLGAVQPLIVLILARMVLDTPFSARLISVAITGVGGVALLVLGPNAALDPIGIGAALIGAISMAFGTVLSRKWKPDVSALTFTAWQLTAGGGLLVPIAKMLEPSLPRLSATNLAGFLWLGLIGAALSYAFWFRGIARLGPATATSFGFLSPLTAVVLGWTMLGETLTALQIAGAGIVIACVWISSRAPYSSSSQRASQEVS